MANKKILFLLASSRRTVGGGKKLLAQLTNLFPETEKLIILTDGDLEFSHEGTTVDLCSPPSQNLVLKIYRFATRVRKVRMLKRMFKPNVSISLMEGANFINIFSSIGENIVVSTHTDLNFFPVMKTSIGFIYKFLIRYGYKKADLVATVSQGVARSLKALGVPCCKIKVIYPFIDLDVIQSKMNEPIEDIFYDCPYLLNVGRLSPAKGQWYLLRFLKELKESWPRLKLLILGEGELQMYLLSLANELGLRTFVRGMHKLTDAYDVYFLGFNENPFKYMAKAMLFVLPSLWEGFPIALVEALACGVPIMAADLPGPREILAPETDITVQTVKPFFAEYGILLPRLKYKNKKYTSTIDSTERIWVETMDTLLRKEELRLCYATKGLRRASEFDIRHIGPKWKAVIDEVYKS